MRVLLSPAAEEAGASTEVARALAGPEGDVRALSRAGVRNIRRRLSQAEIYEVRKALLGLVSGEALDRCPPTAASAPPPDDEGFVVGFVCVARRASAGGETPAGQPDPPVVAVEDHANLTWRSPLRGPNDDALGPRFPVMAGLYRPGIVREALGSFEPYEAIVGGVVAGVRDERALTAFERGVVERHGFPWASSELVNVAILAAHLGLRLAAGAMII